MLHDIGTQVIDVTGELIVQEGFCFFPRDTDDADVGQGGEDRTIASSVQLAGSVTEIIDSLVVETGAGGAESIFQARGHLLRYLVWEGSFGYYSASVNRVFLAFWLRKPAMQTSLPC
jgi:hypothetical protein